MQKRQNFKQKPIIQYHYIQMQRQTQREETSHVRCQHCKNYIPNTRYSTHNKQCKLSRSSDSSNSSDQSEHRRRQKFFGAMQRETDRSQNNNHYRKQQRQRDQMRQCKHCHNQYSYNYIYQHQSFCYKNQEANELRKQLSDSSYQADQHYRGRSSSSQEHQRQRQPVARQRQSFFHHQTRRHYTLSQTSSEEQQSEHYWRNFHENRIMSAAQNLCVRTYRTRLEGISLLVTSNGQTGEVLKRVVYNERTQERRQITQHRYLRHYAMYVIDFNAPANTRNAQNSNRSHNIQLQLQQALERLATSLNQLQGSIKTIKTGMTQEELSVFQKWKYENHYKQNEKCLICLQEYIEAEYLLTLKCFHSFHEGCIVVWLKQQPNCPLCKSKQN